MIYLLWNESGKGKDIVTKKPLSLKKMQQLIGGYIEFCPLPNGHVLVVNEDGLSLGLKTNTRFPFIVGKAIEGMEKQSGNGSIEFEGF